MLESSLSGCPIHLLAAPSAGDQPAGALLLCVCQLNYNAKTERLEGEQMKYSAEAFSLAGDQYLGRSYDEMDCQKFMEICMRDVGLMMDLGGSNSWYREVKKNGWVGTPEECMKIFGQIPKGALLFIRDEVGPKTPKKFRNDGIGDITHIGIKTGRGDGAIHSSHSKGGVVTSVFKDKTIKNGGWNRVGLYNRFDYTKSVNWLLDHMGIGEDPDQKKEEEPMTVTVYAGNGKPVNFRKSPSESGERIDKIPVGTEAELLGSQGDWSMIRIDGKTGWMKTEFLVADDSQIPDEPDPGGQSGSDQVALYFTVDELAQLLPVLEKTVEQIVNKVGRG